MLIITCAVQYEFIV